MYTDYYLYYISYFTSVYSGYPLIVRLTVVVITLLILVTLFGIIRLLFLGYKINRQEVRQKKITDNFKDKLTFLMGNKVNYDIEEIDKMLAYDVKKTKKWKTEMLTDLVLSIRNELRKEGTLNLLNYKNCSEIFQLTSFWEKRMKVSSLSKRREALLTIGALDTGLNSGALSKSVFHKNNHLRRTARDLFTGQDSYNPFRFMEENFDESFTQLDKIRLHATLIKRSNEGRLPNLMRWVSNSKNPNYLAFIIQEIGFFKQHEAASNLLALLDRQENRDVRRQIILTLGELQYQACVDYLIQKFPLESTPVREAIVKTFGMIAGEKTLNLLLEAYGSTNDDSFRIGLVRAIHAHGKTGKSKLLQLKKEGKESEEIIIDQVITENLLVSS